MKTSLNFVTHLFFNIISLESWKTVENLKRSVVIVSCVAIEKGQHKVKLHYTLVLKYNFLE